MYAGPVLRGFDGKLNLPFFAKIKDLKKVPVNLFQPDRVPRMSTCSVCVINDATGSFSYHLHI